jgi:hypothetical protein
MFVLFSLPRSPFFYSHWCWACLCPLVAVLPANTPSLSSSFSVC